jgi:restriction system protein
MVHETSAGINDYEDAQLVCDVLNGSRTMARRKKNEGWFDLFLWLFTRYSAWLCIPVATVVFIAINVSVLAVTSNQPALKGFAQLGPMLGGFAALIALTAGVTAAIGKRTRRKIYNAQTSIESIRELSWSQFELLIGEAYRRQAYEVIETGGAAADGGIDLKLKSERETVLVQCKQWKVYKVGVKPIRELYGVLMAEHADRAIFVTTGGYTREAEQFAKGKPIQLIDGAGLCELIEPVAQQGLVMPCKLIDRERGKHNVSGSDTDLPACPTCRGAMVLRIAKRGNRIGSQFWGCSAYPQCRGTRPRAPLAA